MTRQVALLRGINVGKNNRIAMADLRGLLESLGYDDVRTHLMSGNAIFSTTKAAKVVEAEIERGLDKHLCPGIKVAVRTRSQLAKVIDSNPLPEHAKDGSKFLVIFLSATPARRVLAEIDPADFAPEQFRAARREIYLWAPGGVQDSKLNKALIKKLTGLTATARNWNTVTKLLELAAG
ncbi:MAG: DUF1697 domain-containing protein [Mycobacteriales bacterium]